MVRDERTRARVAERDKGRYRVLFCRPMRKNLALRALHFAFPVMTLGALGAFLDLGCVFGPEVFWVCLNPVTGKLDRTIYDENHFVNGVADPCHCYDPCGPEKTCPIEVDAGELGAGCDAGDGG